MSSVPGGEFLLYQTEDGRTPVECRCAGESLRLLQAGMAGLFKTGKQIVARHLKAIFAGSGLGGNSVVNFWLTTASGGRCCRVSHHNLSAILAEGCRVRPPRGTQ